MCVRIPWRLTCGCEDPARSTLQQCPKAIDANTETCKGVITSPILGDEPCQRCINLVMASYTRGMSDLTRVDSTDVEAALTERPEIHIVSEDGSSRPMDPGEVAVWEETLQWNEDTQVELRVTVMKEGGKKGRKERIRQLWRRISNHKTLAE